jgi:hypothetical protein
MTSNFSLSFLEEDFFAARQPSYQISAETSKATSVASR